MKLVFCLSNLFVPKTLSIIKNANENVLIYTDQRGLEQFFKDLNLDNVEIYYRHELYLHKSIRSIINYLRKRCEIYKMLRSKDLNEIFFFHNSFGAVENWLIKKLKQNKKIFYSPTFSEIPFKVRYSSRALVDLIFYRLFDGIKMMPLWTGEKYIFRLDNSYFKSINSIKVDIVPDEDFINDLIKKSFSLGDKKILLLTGSIVELGQVSETEYVNKTDKLINFIGKENILVKPHPRFPNRFGLEDTLELVPHYIPANVLFKKFQIFIGYSTTVLTEAANEGLTAISLLEYLTPNSQERKNSYKDYLLKNLSSSDNIYFPEQLDDFKKIVTIN